MNKKVALFPGSFDPFTKGHESIISKALTVFDEVIIGVGVNTGKNSFFDADKRIQHIQSIYKNTPCVRVEIYSTLTVDFAKKVKASHIIRGLRNSNDFIYEHAIAQMNLDMTGIESVFFFTDKNFSAVSSSLIREIYKNGGKIDAFVTNVSILV
ncbi:MAG: pantetheine-phosphate adenylyltransferase [Crocinitomicaceae bacterium]